MDNFRQPPKWIENLLYWVAGRANVEDMIGDLHERYYQDLESERGGARMRFIWQCFSVMFSYSLRSRKRDSRSAYSSSGLSGALTMLRHYFKISTRNLIKYRLFSVINIAGLAIAMSVGLVILAMINDLLSYDKFHGNASNIERIVTNIHYPSYGTDESASAPLPLADVLKDRIPGVEKVVRLDKSLSGMVESEEKKLFLKGLFADAQFYSLFSFKLLEGNPDTALEGLNQLVITTEAADKFFGHWNVVGKVVRIEPYGDFTISGLAETPPNHSHIQFEILGSFQTYENYISDFTTKESWSRFGNSYVYFETSNGFEDETAIGALNSEAAPIFDENEVSLTFSFQNILSIIPGPDLSNQIGPKMLLLPIFILSAIALLILLSAVFNYTNLSIARATKRSKEIGLRKVAGSSRQSIFTQFVMETVLLSVLSLIASYFLFTLIRPEVFNIIPRADEVFTLEMTPQLWVFFVSYSVLAGFIAGFFPAIHFSRVEPLNALRDKQGLHSKKSRFRRALVVAQFVLSLFFVTAVFLINKQYSYTLNYDLGFTTEQVLNIPLKDREGELVKNELSKSYGVQAIGLSSHMLGGNSSMATYTQREDASDSVYTFYMNADDGFVTASSLEILAGSNFNNEITSERRILVNEQFLQVHGIERPEDAINELISSRGGEMRISGVVKDFNYMHLEEPIRAFMIVNDPEGFTMANALLKTEDIQLTIAELESNWKAIPGKEPFFSRFYADELEEAYSHLVNIMKLAGFLGFTAISIACLGLLGMTVFTSETRTKEIGIRKVMGARTGELVWLLSKGFLRMLFIAALIALPIAYILFDNVILPLQVFRAQIGVVEMIAGLGIVLLLGLAAIGSQTLSAARKNPVDSLRIE